MNALSSGAGLVSGHFARYRRRSPWSFCWRIALESVAVSFAVAAALVPFLSMQPRALLDLPYYVFFVLGVLIAPPIETVLFQALPVGLMRLFRAGFWWQVLVSSALFAAVHFREGAAVGLSAGLVTGFYFAFTYAHWRGQSRWTALWTTTVCHGIHNAVAILLLLPYWLLR